MAKRLLNRQASLLRYLTSGAAIVGDAEAALDRSLRGLDNRLLHLEALFSHQKRMGMVAALLPRTFQILAARRDLVELEFAKTAPPTTLDAVANAQQFCEFLAARRCANSELPYLPDVAACELACAEVQRQGNGDIGHSPRPRSGRLVRRHPATAMLRCQYDVRSIFESDCGAPPPPRRNTALVVSMPTGAPRVFEVHPSVFAWLMELESWTDFTAYGHAPELRTLMAELVNHRLLEVRE
jgi:hypothetical protein